jgi:hypothetical protein
VGTGKWEAIRIPLTRRLEHWDGAKDGKIHYPIQNIVFCEPTPAADVERSGLRLGSTLERHDCQVVSLLVEADCRVEPLSRLASN